MHSSRKQPFLPQNSNVFKCGAGTTQALFFSLLKASIDTWSCQVYWEEFHRSICHPWHQKTTCSCFWYFISQVTTCQCKSSLRPRRRQQNLKCTSPRLDRTTLSPPQIPLGVLRDHWDQTGLSEVLAQCCVIGSNQWHNRTAACPQLLSPVEIPASPNGLLSSGPPCSAAHISSWLATKSCSRLDAAQQYHVSYSGAKGEFCVSSNLISNRN